MQKKYKNKNQELLAKRFIDPLLQMCQKQMIPFVMN